MNFLEGRSQREKMLVYIAAALFLVFFIWLALWRPVQSYYTEAQMREQKAASSLQIVTAGLGQITPTSNGSGANGSGGQPFNRGAVIEAARSAGLPISRVQPENSGALKVWFNDTKSETFYEFLKRFSAQYDAEIASVQISRAGDGLINAQVSFMAKNG